jgi:hypothetical protein
MARSEINDVSEKFVECLEVVKVEYRTRPKGEQDDFMDYLIKKYLEKGKGYFGLLLVFTTAFMAAGERSVSYLQSRIPFKERLELFKKLDTPRNSETIQFARHLILAEAEIQAKPKTRKKPAQRQRQVAAL